MESQRFRSLDDFWPYYVRQHSKKLTRQWHFIGNLNLVLWMYWASSRRSFFLVILGVFTSYLFAWVGHFLVERNIPATFQYPALSALADMRMFVLMLQGRMDAEVEKYIEA